MCGYARRMGRIGHLGTVGGTNRPSSARAIGHPSTRASTDLACPGSGTPEDSWHERDQNQMWAEPVASAQQLLTGW